MSHQKLIIERLRLLYKFTTQINIHSVNTSINAQDIFKTINRTLILKRQHTFWLQSICNNVNEILVLIKKH